MPKMFRRPGTTPNGFQWAMINGIRYNKSYTSQPWSFLQMYDAKVQRFEVRSGDIGFSGDPANHNERSEIVTADFRSLQSTKRAYSGTDYWVSHAFMIERGAEILSSYALCGQMHDISDPADIALSPPLCFVLAASATDTVTYTAQTRGDPSAATPSQITPIVRWSTTLTRGVWARMVTRMRFDPFGAGQLQIWRDGVEQINLSGLTFGYNNPEDQAYWQMGIYRAENANTLAVRYGNVEQGAASLIDRVTTPLEIPADRDSLEP